MLLQQVKVLVKKDLWILKSHKKSLIAELLVPLIVTALAAVVLYKGLVSVEPSVGCDKNFNLGRNNTQNDFVGSTHTAMQPGHVLKDDPYGGWVSMGYSTRLFLGAADLQNEDPGSNATAKKLFDLGSHFYLFNQYKSMYKAAKSENSGVGDTDGSSSISSSYSSERALSNFDAWMSLNKSAVSNIWDCGFWNNSWRCDQNCYIHERCKEPKWRKYFQHMNMIPYVSQVAAVEGMTEYYTGQMEAQYGSGSQGSFVITLPNHTLPITGPSTIQWAANDYGWENPQWKTMLNSLAMLENLYYRSFPMVPTNTTSSGSKKNTYSFADSENLTPKNLYHFPAAELSVSGVDSWSSAALLNTYQFYCTIVAAIMQLTSIPLAMTTAGRLVEEKRTKMREHLRVMGVRSTAYIVSVFGFGIFRVTLITCVMFITFVATSKSIIGGGIIFQVILVQWLFGVSLLSFSTLMPCFFKRSIFSSSIVFLFVIVFTVGAIFVTDEAIPVQAQWASAALFSPTAALMCSAQILGGHLTTLAVSPGVCLFFLLLQTFWYSLLSQYLYALWPGEYGVPQQWYFPFYMLNRAFRGDYSSGKETTGGETSDSDSVSASLMQNAHAVGSSGMATAKVAGGGGGGYDSVSGQEDSVVLKNLYKYFGSQRDTAAVDGLDLSIHRGEIFALLGHNGAGKTTTVSMLTGMFPPTSYDTAFVDGMDLKKDIDQIRHNITVCPQFDILFEDLSAMEHMELFAAFKGITNERGKEILEKLGLPLDKQKSVTFSGGMKRRLSVACAMIGGSPIVFLDEPSSGLDPMSRRQLWDMIREEKQHGKTIILITHFMEEADYLGDRIGIMSRGKLYCCETSTALKHEYGVGYYLTVVKSEEASATKAVTTTVSDEEMKAHDVSTVAFDMDNVLALCNRHCPGTSIVQESMGDASLLLPAEHFDQFGPLLTELDLKQKTELGVSSYGVRMNTLEDVFVHISEKESQATAGNSGGDPLDVSAHNTAKLTTPDHHEISTEELFASSVRLNPILLFLSQVLTVMRKKALFFVRSPRLLFLGIVMPIVLVIVALAIAIPPPPNPSAGQSSYNYYNTYSNEAPPAKEYTYPDYSRWDVPYIGETQTAEQQSILNRFAQLVLQNSSKFPAYGSSLTNEKNTVPVRLAFPKFSLTEVSMNGYVDTKSLSPLSSGPGVPFILGNGGNWDIVVRKENWNTQYKGVGFSPQNNPEIWAFELSDSLDPRINVLIFQCLRQAWLEYQSSQDTAGAEEESSNAEFFMNIPVEFSQVEKPSGLTAAPPPAGYEPPTPIPPTPLPSNMTAAPPKWKPKIGPSAWTLAGTGILLCLTIAQYAACTTITVADEINRKVFHSLRMHGLSAFAYWTGTLFFDAVIAAIVIIGSSVVGLHVRGIDILTINSNWGTYQSFIILGNIIFILLSAYAFMCYFPSLKPSTLIVIVLIMSIVLLLVPLGFEEIWLTRSPPKPEYVGPTDPDAPGSWNGNWNNYDQYHWHWEYPPAPLPPTWLYYSTPQHSLMSVYLYIANNFNITEDPWAAEVKLNRTDGYPEDYNRFVPMVHGCMWSSWFWSLVPIFVIWSHASAIPRALNRRFGPRSRALEDCDEVDPADLDADVRAELERVKSQLQSPNLKNSGQSSEDMVQAVGLKKIYPGKWCCCCSTDEKHAVRDLTFGVRKGECFGLLGPNGAGKTTAVKMLLKEHGPTRGQISYPYTTGGANSWSLDTDYREARLGVCQQHDTLWETFTAAEHLDLYLRIRLGFSYKSSVWKDYIANAIRKVYLDTGAAAGATGGAGTKEKRADQYSGGMKRKLAVAIALYTGAKTVFLDEPSTGMDPYARRAMWKSIKEALANDRGVILTTHSMEEADAVCARIAIVTKGAMQCIGSSQHLKNKFGTGYAITLLLKAGEPQPANLATGGSLNKDEKTASTSANNLTPSDTTAVTIEAEKRAEEYDEDEELTKRLIGIDATMKENFGEECERGEMQGFSVQYRLPQLNIAAAFTMLSSTLAKELHLESYSVNQVTSLEQIFIGFAAEQDDTRAEIDLRAAQKQLAKSDQTQERMQTEVEKLQAEIAQLKQLLAEARANARTE